MIKHVLFRITKIKRSIRLLNLFKTLKFKYILFSNNKDQLFQTPLYKKKCLH